MEINSVGIVGYGHFGQFLGELAKKYLPEARIKFYSRRFIPDQKEFFSITEVCQSDVVVLACAIKDYESTVKEIQPMLAAHTVVVDVATVKVHTSNLFKKYLLNQPYVCTHPMFGPESYKKTAGDVSGYKVVITDVTLSRRNLEKVTDFLSDLGFAVSEMTATEHDQYLANTLFLTHYIGQTMKAGEFTRTPIDSVSFGSLMNAVESVQNDEKLFHDVYQYNPFCRAAAERFHEAQEQVYQKLPK